MILTFPRLKGTRCLDSALPSLPAAVGFVSGKGKPIDKGVKMAEHYGVFRQST